MVRVCVGCVDENKFVLWGDFSKRGIIGCKCTNCFRLKFYDVGRRWVVVAVREKEVASGWMKLFALPRAVREARVELLCTVFYALFQRSNTK